MKLNRTLVMCLTIALAAAVAIGGTTAYLTSTSGQHNIMTLGNVGIVQNEQQRGVDEEGNPTLDNFVQHQKLLPAYHDDEPEKDGCVTVNGVEYPIVHETVDGEVDKIVTVSNIGSEPAYVRTLFAFEDTNGMFSKLHVVWHREAAFPTQTTLEGTTEYIRFTHEGTTYIVGVYVYEAPLDEGGITAPSMLQIYWDKSVTKEELAQAGSEYDILVLSQAVQARMGDLSAAAALDEAFGVVTPGNAEQIKQWFLDADLLVITPGGASVPADPTASTDPNAGSGEGGSIADE